MADILHDFFIKAPLERVFAVISTPEGVDQWWTKRCSGTSAVGEEYVLWFSEEHDWRGKVTVCDPHRRFEWEIMRAMEDWTGSRVGFELTAADGGTQVRFHHQGWAERNEHFRISSYCWAMYMRILKRHVEHGERVPYEVRLEV